MDLAQLPNLVNLCRDPTSDLIMLNIFLDAVLLEFLAVDLHPRRDAVE